MARPTAWSLPPARFRTTTPIVPPGRQVKIYICRPPARRPARARRQSDPYAPRRTATVGHQRPPHKLFQAGGRHARQRWCAHEFERQHGEEHGSPGRRKGQPNGANVEVLTAPSAIILPSSRRRRHGQVLRGERAPRTPMVTATATGEGEPIRQAPPFGQQLADQDAGRAWRPERAEPPVNNSRRSPSTSGCNGTRTRA